MGADISREVVSLRSGTTVRKRRAARRLADIAFDRNNKDAIAQEGEEMFKKGVPSKTCVCFPGGIGPLVELLKSRDRECRSNAVFAVAMLAEDVQNRSTIVDEGGLPALVRLLAYGGDREKACAARTIGMIVAEDKNSKEAVRTEGGIPMLVRLLKSPNVMSTQQAAMALANLTTTTPDHTLKATLSSEGGLVPLLRLLNKGDELSRMWATIIISHIADDSDSKKAILREGGIRCIVRQLRSHMDDSRLNAASALSSLCENEPAIQREIVREKGVSPLVTMLEDAKDVCREQAAFVLDILSKNKDTCHAVIREGAVRPSLKLLDSDCEYCRVSASCMLANLSCSEEGCDSIEEHGGVEKMLDLVGPLKNEQGGMPSVHSATLVRAVWIDSCQSSDSLLFQHDVDVTEFVKQLPQCFAVLVVESTVDCAVHRTNARAVANPLMSVLLTIASRKGGSPRTRALKYPLVVRETTESERTPICDGHSEKSMIRFEAPEATFHEISCFAIGKSPG